MYLVDTDVLSALRRPERHVSVTRWVSAQRNEDLHLSVVSVGEIERGIAKARRRDPSFASALEGWLERVLSLYGDRILPLDLAAARRWGTMSHAVGHGGADLFIAATALRHGLTVVTRNVRHFEPVGVPVLNPFDLRSASATARQEKRQARWRTRGPGSRGWTREELYERGRSRTD